MTRISKKAQRRAISPRKCKKPSVNKTGPKKDNLPLGYKPHKNVIQGDTSFFIGKIKERI